MNRDPLVFTPQYDSLKKGEVTASYTLSLGINNQVKRVTGSGTVVMTIPSDDTLDLELPDNRMYVHHVGFDGTGSARWEGAAGVTVESPPNGTLTMSTRKQFSTAMKMGPNLWWITGSTDAEVIS